MKTRGEEILESVHTLRKATKFSGKYRGVLISLLHHGEDQMPNGIWCAYMHLTSELNPEIKELRGKSDPFEFAGRRRDRMTHHPFFDSLDWHGGVTFYEETETIGGVIRMKIGHDYAHSWDSSEGSIYPDKLEEDQVYADIVKVVDEYRSVYPETQNGRMIESKEFLQGRAKFFEVLLSYKVPVELIQGLWELACTAGAEQVAKEVNRQLKSREPLKLDAKVN